MPRVIVPKGGHRLACSRQPGLYMKHSRPGEVGDMWTDTLICGLAGALFLAAFYRSVRLRWPETYSGMRRPIDSYVSERPSRYLAFRAVPVYVVAVFVSVTTTRLHGHAAAGVAFLGLLHVSHTSGRGMVRLYRASGPAQGRRNVAFYYVGSMAIVALACLGAASTAHHLAATIPAPAELSGAAWTGIFAAVLAVSLQSLSAEDVSIAALLARARADVGDRLWTLTRELAWQHHTDADLLTAIVASEALQRPRWLRRGERLRGRFPFLRRGSYGVAQITSSRPLTDEDSVSLLAQAFDGYLPQRGAGGYLLPKRLEARLEQHNSSEAFINQVKSIYGELQPYPRYATTALAFDGRPLIACTSVTRSGDWWKLVGTAAVSQGAVKWTSSLGGSTHRGEVESLPGGDGRFDWRLSLPLATTQVLLSDPLVALRSGATSDAQILVDLDNA
jgi:hypothetical protein